ncbi:MAG: efflux RND transporter periplasmic adaptor subunit [Nannocystales bacterium]
MKFIHRPTLVLAGVLSACSLFHPDDHAHDAEGEHAAPGDKRDAVASTTWTENTELFVEFPVLVVGHESPFAAHFTWLEGFGPVATGQVSVVLSGGGGAEETFSSEPSSTPGIFRPVVSPSHAGERQVLVVLESAGKREEHSLGTIRVLVALPDAPPSEPEDDGSISFLKEQQWKMRFSTAVVRTGSMRPSFSAFGTAGPRADGDVVVGAPATGRLVTAKGPLPVVGSTVDSGGVLARLIPRLEGTADVASLDLAGAAARLDVEQAVRERERLEGLLASGVVPERRVAEARHAEAAARAQLKAANRRTGQYRRVQRAGGKGAQGIEVRTPLAGSVLEIHAVAGAFVEDGAPLFRVVDPKTLWLSARVPEIDVPQISAIDGAWFDVPGAERRVEVGADALVTRGGVVDPVTRTVDVVFAIPNPDGLLRVGAAVQVHLTIGQSTDALSVSEESIIIDSGLAYVFVQAGGESFERRQVRTGIRDRGRVQIIEGVTAGERVVGDGAYAVKLASASTAPPAHGHAH